MKDPVACQTAQYHYGISACGCNAPSSTPTCEEGISLSNLSAPDDESFYTAISVSAGDTVTCSTIHDDAMGDADIYFDFEGYLRPCPGAASSGDDTCSFTVAHDGVLVVNVWASSGNYSGVALECTCEQGPPPDLPTCKTGGVVLRETLNTYVDYDSNHLEIEIEEGDTVTCRTSGGNQDGDADMYMYFDASRGIRACTSDKLDTNDEECSTRAARTADGTSVIVEVQAYEVYKDVEIICFCNGDEFPPTEECPNRGSSLFFGSKTC